MMFERKQVLNGLKCHSGCDRAFNCCDCAYIGYSNCSEILARDALILLEEDETFLKVISNKLDEILTRFEENEGGEIGNE